MKNRDRHFMVGSAKRCEFWRDTGLIESPHWREPGRVRDKKPVDKHLTG